MLQAKNDKKHIMLCIFAASAILAFGADAQDDVSLESIEVIETSEQDIKDRKVSEIKKTDKDIAKQQISDTRDLVRHETGISVVETGRMGSSGYSIRGVDENRVDISIDGLRQAETISSQGFKELFEGYGNFNNTRNGVEVENVKQVNFTKGADSIKSGSGALGGSVMFETKDARDFLIDKDYYYGAKRGYSSVDNQNWQSHTVAARIKWFDFMLVRTKRRGHELENYGYNHYDPLAKHYKREKADPYTIKRDSTLLKFGLQLNDTNRFSIGYDNSKNRVTGIDWSNALTSITTSKNINSLENMTDSIRHVKDTSERKNINFNYENYDETLFWDNIKIGYSKQTIKLQARTDEYCDGKNCKDIKNESGINLTQDGRQVDQYGKKLQTKTEIIKVIGDTAIPGQYTQVDFESDVTSLTGYKTQEGIIELLQEYVKYNQKWGAQHGYEKPNIINQPSDILQDSKGNFIDGSLHSRVESTRADKIKIDCTKFNCNNSLELITYTPGSNYSSNNMQYKTYSLTRTLSDNNYATLNSAGNEHIILPNTIGYLENLWKDRTLNTQTKQFNIDATKDINIRNIEHALSYGLLYNEIDKSMINKIGANYRDLQWWRKYFILDNKHLKSSQNDSESFLIPVKSKTGALYLRNDMQINDWLGIDVGYRYDRIKHEPHYILGISPKIPDDMVRGSIIPLETYKIQEPELVKGNWWDYPTREHYDQLIAQYNKAKAFYDAEVARVDKINTNNVEQNLQALQKQRHFSNSSYAITTTFDPTSYLRIQTKYSTAFRAPTSDELYFTFMHPDFTIRPNTNLKEEEAKTKEIAFTLYKSPSFVTLNFFRTDYKNFIDLSFLGEQQLNIFGGKGIGRTYNIYQNINRDKAKVNGFELTSKLFLDQIYTSLKGFSIGHKLTYQRGRMHVKNHHKKGVGNTITEAYENAWVPMNAIQPLTNVFNVGYTAPNNKFGIDTYVTHAKAKEGKDTYDTYWFDKDNTNTQLKWRSTSYTIVDITGFYSPIKNLTLRAGVYNIGNKKYLTWENARSIRSFGATNRIDDITGLGINRFLAPGRNFKLTFEFSY